MKKQEEKLRSPHYVFEISWPVSPKAGAIYHPIQVWS